MRRGQTLVGLLAVMAIIAILSAVYFFGSGTFGGERKSPRKDGRGTTIPGLVKLEAQDTVCQSNLNQVRQAIGVAQTTEDQFPGSIDELPNVRSLAKCPIGGETYNYDATTGAVSCPHPGHEKY